MGTTSAWLERHQVAGYLGALLLGGAAGLLAPAVAGRAAPAVTPLLALLLYVTFLGIPFARIRQATRDGRFLGAVLALNFLVVPAVAFALSRLVASDRVLLVGVLFVLLTPCVDYVIVFTGLAGGAADRLLAATPVLMLGQMALLPLYLWWFVGPDVVAVIDPGPFLEAFVLIIALPLAAAAVTQAVGNRRGATSGAAAPAAASPVQRAAALAMVPLMAVTLAVVVASQIAGVGAHARALAPTIPVYVLFVVVMVPLGLVAARATGLDPGGSRALVLSGTTRNSLVVLPLALALPAGFELAPLAVVTQTLVELLAMTVLVRLVPRLVPAAAR